MKINAPEIKNNCLRRINALRNSVFFPMEAQVLFIYLLIYFCLVSRNLIRARLKEFGDLQN